MAFRFVISCMFIALNSLCASAQDTINREYYLSKRKGASIKVFEDRLVSHNEMAVSSLIKGMIGQDTIYERRIEYITIDSVIDKGCQAFFIINGRIEAIEQSDWDCRFFDAKSKMFIYQIGKYKDIYKRRHITQIKSEEGASIIVSKYTRKHYLIKIIR